MEQRLTLHLKQQDVILWQKRLAYCDEPITRQILTRRFLLARHMKNAQAFVTAEHFVCKGLLERYRQHATVNFLAETYSFKDIDEGCETHALTKQK